MSEHYTVYFNGPLRTLRSTTDIWCEEYRQVEWLQVAITPPMETAADAERWADAWCGLGQATDATTVLASPDAIPKPDEERVIDDMRAAADQLQRRAIEDRAQAHQLSELYDLLEVDSLAAAIDVVKDGQGTNKELITLLENALQEYGAHDELGIEPSRNPLQLDSEPAILTCRSCHLPATCLGAYEGDSEVWPSCDICCGHGNEDGFCNPIEPVEESRPTVDRSPEMPPLPPKLDDEAGS